MISGTWMLLLGSPDCTLASDASAMAPTAAMSASPP
jgi:hypothetical protein